MILFINKFLNREIFIYFYIKSYFRFNNKINNYLNWKEKNKKINSILKFFFLNIIFKLTKNNFIDKTNIKKNRSSFRFFNYIYCYYDNIRYNRVFS